MQRNAGKVRIFPASSGLFLEVLNSVQLRMMKSMSESLIAVV